MSKVLSVRLNAEDEEKLRALADELDVGPSVLARMLLHASLSQLDQLRGERFPLSLLGDLLAPAAREQDLDEAGLAGSVKAARQRLWAERYGERS